MNLTLHSLEESLAGNQAANGTSEEFVKKWNKEYSAGRTGNRR